MVWSLLVSENSFPGVEKYCSLYSLMLLIRTPLVGFFGNGEIGVSHQPSDSGVVQPLIWSSFK